MGTPLHTRLDKYGHRVYMRKKSEYRSVTTVIEKSFPKEALHFWSANMVAAKALELSDELVQIRDNEGDKRVLEILRSAPQQYSNDRSKIGDLVHNSIEDWILTEERPECEIEEVCKRLDQFDKFVDDWKPRIVHTEVSVFSDRYQYAGTLDLMMKINGSLYIGDIKTGKSVWDEAALQMAAYTRADYMLIGNKEVPMPKVSGALILHLTPDAYKLHPANISDEVFEQFLRLRETYRFHYEREGRLRYRPIKPSSIARMNGHTPEWVKEMFKTKAKKRG